MRQRVNTAIIGGSGFWSNQSHHKHIRELRSQLPVSLTAIVDPVDPHSLPEHENLAALLETDQTAWLKPDDFGSTDELVQQLRNVYQVDLVIIASNPCTHFAYGLSCIHYGLNVLCDKPILTTTNASTDLGAALAIRRQYDQLEQAYRTAQRNQPALLFHSILRRRSLAAFMHVATELATVYDQTGAGINTMTIMINGGIYKLPAEFQASGAHGYLDGVGSMAHSAYHYIDVLAWFLSQAPGEAVELVPRLNYVLRVGDYLEARGYRHIADLVHASPESLRDVALSKEVLGCELNAGFTFTIENSRGLPIGEISFLFNHISFAPRTNDYHPAVHEPANRKGGGRMSYFFIDVNQDGLQSWQLSKNDIVFEGNKIALQGRRHPLLEGDEFESRVYENAYEPEISLKDLLAYTLEQVLKDEPIEGHSVIRGLSEEHLATEIYAACYELIASDYQGVVVPRSSRIRIK